MLLPACIPCGKVVRSDTHEVEATDASGAGCVRACEALGYDDVVAPPTFAMVIQDQTLQQLLAEPDSGIVLERVVHAEQRFRYTRPIVAGDELTGALTVTGIRAFGKGAMVTSEAEITDAAGSHVVTATSVLLVGGDE